MMEDMIAATEASNLSTLSETGPESLLLVVSRGSEPRRSGDVVDEMVMLTGIVAYTADVEATSTADESYDVVKCALVAGDDADECVPLSTRCRAAVAMATLGWVPPASPISSLSSGSISSRKASTVRASTDCAACSASLLYAYC